MGNARKDIGRQIVGALSACGDRPACGRSGVSGRRHEGMVVQSLRSFGPRAVKAGPQHDETRGMSTDLRTGPHMRGGPESHVGRRAITFAGLSLSGIALLVLSFALGIVEPADSYTDSWTQLVWGVGIWTCAVAAFVTGLIAIVRHDERSWMVMLATALGLLPVVLLVSEIALGKF